MTTDATFEAINSDATTQFGPPALLAIGHSREEAGQLVPLLEGVGATEHQVVCCSKTMGQWKVADALAGADDGELLEVGQVPRVVLLSGLSDAQLNGLLDRYANAGLPRPIFAVATPNNLEFTVIELLEELLAEQRAMANKN